MELKIEKQLIDEAIQKAVEEFKQNYIFVPDGMTNGEVIQALFSNPHIETKSHTVWVGYDGMSFTREWWN